MIRLRPSGGPGPPSRRYRESRMTRENLITRDGRTCVWCGREPWPADLTAEHLLPRSRRGRTMPENLAVAPPRLQQATPD
jgi:5-methylcytosine-specific restriction endonuclease McrA